MTVIGLMVLCACTAGDDETAVVSVADETLMPISFGGLMQEEQTVTRTATPLSETATEFKVWGYKNMTYSADNYGGLQTVFPGYTVRWEAGTASTTVTNSSNWEYILPSPFEQTVKYWDWGAKAYRFFAVTGAAAADAAELAAAPQKYLPGGTAGAPSLSFRVDATSETELDKMPYFTRMWFSTGDPVAYSEKLFGHPVVLEFVKPLTRVRFLFTYVFPREGIVLEDISFHPSSDNPPTLPADAVGIVRKSIVTVTYPLSGTATEEIYTTAADADKSSRLSAFTEDYDPEDDTKVYSETDEGWYSVAPNVGQDTFTLSLRVNGAERTCTVPVQYMQWLPGYSYTYVFRITEVGGVEIGWVESAVTPWTIMNTSHTVYNW